MLTVLLALGTAFGLCMLAWLFYGWLLLPVEGQKTIRILISASGDGMEAERAVRALRWLISSGLLCARLELIDAGLEEAGKARLIRTARHYPGVRLRRQRAADPSEH